MSYDPDARRDTPLALKIKERIRRDGPIAVADYMRACLDDEDHGYYRRRPAIGAGGDFTTAPEISQVFGELVGLWCAVVWQQMGSPDPFNLIEHGPGRGTLMADALRAMRRVPACLAAARVRLVEVNPVLEREQRQRLAGALAPVTWHRHTGDGVEPLPSIVLANEVLDTEPVTQVLSHSGRRWPRGVGIDRDKRLAFCALPSREGDLPPPDAIVEETRGLSPIIGAMAGIPLAAALLIDYGHTRTAPGDTLQAVRNHAFEHPLTSPGEADLTAQVDFERLAALARGAGFSVDGPVTQATFLGTLGIAERASRLMSANPALAAGIEAGVARLIAPHGMGARFKAIGVRTAGMPPLPGFGAGTAR